MEIKIDSGIPIPKRNSSTKKTIYPFEGLSINDSFIAGEYSEDLVNKINGHIFYYSKKLGCKFSSRKVGDNLRVWRTE